MLSIAAVLRGEDMRRPPHHRDGLWDTPSSHLVSLGDPSFLPSFLPPGCIFSTRLKNSFEGPGDLAGRGADA